MMYRILVVTTYPKLASDIESISKELEMNVDIHKGGIIKGGHLYAQQMEHNYDVIISHGGTAATIREMVKIPVINVEIRLADFFTAILQAQKYENPIILISHKTEDLADLADLGESINLNYKIFPYSDKTDLEILMDQIQHYQDITLVCMGGCIQEYASDLGFKSVLISSSYSSVKKSLLAAKNICDLGKNQREENEKLNTIINYSQEGIIAISASGYIKNFNPQAEEILGLEKEKIIGKNVNLLNIPILNTIYDNGREVLEKVISVNNTQILINRVAMTVRDETIGVLISFQKIAELARQDHKIKSELYTRGLVAKYRYQDIIGESNAITNTINKASRYARTSSTILIYGETGSGKEVFAQAIHNSSDRAQGPFVAVNCAALPENLLESELFGYEEGAFTGARKGGKPGLFELAHNGTIFLDEIGEIPLQLQSRLLRVLQEKELIRIGGDYIISVNVRIISATNRNLYEQVMDGKFREDLYFRLNILNVHIPPLRERKEDIPQLIHFFLREFSQLHNSRVQSINNTALALLKLHHWPGNVRELKNFVEKMVLLSDTPVIREALVEKILQEHNIHMNSFEKDKTYNDSNCLSVDISSLKDMELQIIAELNKKFDGDRQTLAHVLGISRTTLWKRLNELNLNQNLYN